MFEHDRMIYGPIAEGYFEQAINHAEQLRDDHVQTLAYLTPGVDDDEIFEKDEQILNLCHFIGWSKFLLTTAREEDIDE